MSLSSTVSSCRCTEFLLLGVHLSWREGARQGGRLTVAFSETAEPSRQRRRLPAAAPRKHCLRIVNSYSGSPAFRRASKKCFASVGRLNAARRRAVPEIV